MLSIKIINCLKNKTMNQKRMRIFDEILIRYVVLYRNINKTFTTC